MIIKMGGDNIAVHIVGRVLDRSKLLNIPSNGKNNDPSRVLTRGPAHSGAALDDPVDLTVPLPLSPLFIIIFHIAECRLLRQSTDSSRLKGLSRTENNLYIPVGFSLIIPEKFRSISGSLSPLNPRKVSKGISNPSFFRGCPHTGQFLSGISQPALPE